MPVISEGDKVLVSGANGYIAMWTVRLLLERGYAVRGTVRDESKVEYMKKYFDSLGFGDKFETVIVPDIVKEGAFDEAVKDVDGIAHMASPFHTNVKEPEEFISPAVQGTVGMLKSALKNGNKVKRIVITSSCAAVMAPPPKPTVFSEKDWNVTSTREVEEQGNKTAPMTIYRASKTLAEKGAWEFVEQHKSEIKWDLSVINPPFVFGPAIHEVKSLSSLNTSLQTWYDTVVVDSPKSKEALAVSNSWVDVRDTALGHVLALEKPEAGGERIITCEGGYIWQEWINAANSLSPNPLPSHKLPKGFPEITEGERVIHIAYDTSKEQRILGIKYHTKVETTKDTLRTLPVTINIWRALL
ncbi:D-lactaldehyde dehydrogenase [Agrocybe pediades]|nr:D-lactaldehyde dehydrogenase [Agrocybe pediades]